MNSCPCDIDFNFSILIYKLRDAYSLSSEASQVYCQLIEWGITCLHLTLLPLAHTSHPPLSLSLSPSPGTAGGGTGAVFDWTIASKLNVPVILAGESPVTAARP